MVPMTARWFVKRSFYFVPALLIALFLGVASVSAAQVNIKMAGFAFDPATVTVKVGDTVTWANSDTAPHNAVADDGSFKTPDITQGQTTTITATAVGTHTYICTIHPRMKATLIVQAAGAAPGLPSTGFGGLSQSLLPWQQLAMICLLVSGGFAATMLRRRRA
jgi:plastocyanin